MCIEHWVKKCFSLVRKQHGNHLETPGYHHVSPWLPVGKIEDSPERKRPTLRFPGFPCMETRGKPGVSLMETRGKLYGYPRFPKGNHMETSSFPKVNIRDTTWKPHVSNKFPQDRKLMRSNFQENLHGNSFPKKSQFSFLRFVFRLKT